MKWNWSSVVPRKASRNAVADSRSKGTSVELSIIGNLLGFGNVPFHRTEFVAERITGYFNLDLEQLRGYRLGVEMERLLLALALFKVQKFLASGLRLRTACDLAVSSLVVKAPAGFAVSTLNELEAVLPALIQAAQKHFASPPMTMATFSGEKKGKDAKAKKEKTV